MENKKLIIVLALCRAESPVDFAPPLQQAKFAAKMGYPVEVVFTGQTVPMLFGSQLGELRLGDEAQISVYHLLNEAVSAGVKIKACVEMCRAQLQDFIPEVTETVGAAYIVTEALEDNTVTITY